jgi:RNA polymerase sigma factor (sigma-70 family)
LGDTARRQRFEATVLAHLDAAFNLARWMLREDAAAEDAVQDASLRAYRFFDGMHGASPKAWFLAVVRNACLDRVKDSRERALEDEYDDEVHGGVRGAADSPEAALERSTEARRLYACIGLLPVEYREVVVLRELEELSYKEISAIVEVPIGTVMSRLSRGRDLLQQRLLAERARRRS